MKNIILIHGFNGIPKIFEYFKIELEKRDYNVIMPDFPVREEITVEGYYRIFDKYKDIFNSNLIVIAHSIGNAMFIKYMYKNNLTVGKYISLAGFAKEFYNEGKDVLNEKVKLTVLSDNELQYTKEIIKDRYSIYSKDDHIVPYELLKEFSELIDSKSYSIDGIGHMGKKSGLEELPEVIDIVCNE
jgi:predicted alpha/beta hydrolase family esterase